MRCEENGDNGFWRRSTRGWTSPLSCFRSMELSRLNWRRFTCGERRSESFVDKRGIVEVITMIYARCSFSGAFHVPIKYEGYLTKR